MGDAFCAAFPDAPSAARAAIPAQRAFHPELADLRVRMAIHTGEAEERSVSVVAFSPDGKLLATGSADGVDLWPVPPAPADLREMELRTWVALGARLDAQGNVEAIPWLQWQQYRAEPRGCKRF